jgi:hypothetical protein
MGKEQKIQIKTSGQYKNIAPKKDLEQGNHIIIEKKFVDAKEVTGGKFNNTSYLAQVMYAGEEVSFFMTKNEHDVFKEVGGVGDRIKCTLGEKTFERKNKEGKVIGKMIYNTLSFELAK